MTSTSIHSRASSAGSVPKPADETLLVQARSRARTRLGGRERWTSFALGGGFVLAAAAMATLVRWETPFRPATAALLVLSLAFVSRIEFEVGTGSAVPTQVVLVPMLLLLPAPVVPLCVAGGYLLGGIVDSAKGRRHPERLAVLLGSCWHAIGPALVLALFADPTPRWDQWPLYLAALTAQFAFDFASSAGREWIAFGISPRKLLRFFVWVYAVDALLAPVGLLAALESESMRYAFLLALAPVCLLALLAHDRRSRIQRAQAFQHAYDGAHLEARQDALTGLANRLAWEEATARADAASIENATPASVIVLDVDCLKLANDSRGHAFGDEVLRRIAAIVRATVREQDLVARIGGDEIGILLTNADEERCAEAVTRVRQAFAASTRLDGFPLSVTLGSATAAGMTLTEAQRLADDRLYAEKPASTRGGFLRSSRPMTGLPAAPPSPGASPA
jgi:diguanylate cyclase (GGDEF)-like protein